MYTYNTLSFSKGDHHPQPSIVGNFEWPPTVAAVYYYFLTACVSFHFFNGPYARRARRRTKYRQYNIRMSCIYCTVRARTHTQHQMHIILKNHHVHV